MTDAAGDGGAVEGPEALWASVIAALRVGAEDGAVALYAALTPRARGPLGGEEGLRRALANPLLAPLVRPEAVAAEPWDRRGHAARTTVSVDGPHGAARFLVSARHGDDGWRLTGVRRDDLPPA